MICNIQRDVSCREWFKTLNLLPVPCLYIIEISYHIKSNKRVIRQHSVKHDYDMHHRLNFQPQFCRNNSFKNNVNNMGIKLYNNLPSYIKKSENIKFFNKKFKLFLWNILSIL